ncbi:DUF6545 domain-containing protein [Nocardia bovistercoris]|uniref:DUF6545 domain-containing protein n=1 Tax=Nocardia bovistercoris TaxID=2785916 RepID=A0A931IAV6_9NOCA|nr:DUF6545 domain-containing protein [Nocardia bovistercoris]MBH0777626.1 hypothetical protein [Nocardia bovistercoris]
MMGLPPGIMWVIATFALTVSLLRCVFLRDNLTDRLINRALTVCSFGVVLIVLIEPFGVDAITHMRAIFGFAGPSCIYGAARLLAGADPHDAWQRQRRYDLLAVAGIAVTLTIDAAHFFGAVPASVPKAWYSMAATLECVPVALSGFLLLRAGIREIRSDRTPFVRRLVFTLFAAVAGFWICYAAALLVLYFRGAPMADLGQQWSIAGFSFFTAIIGLMGIPLVHIALVRLDLDRDSRDCRRLHPLWSDLIAAVPHVALAPEAVADRGPASRRYRMAIEIRDALLQLRRHAADYRPDDLRGQTLRLVSAAESASREPRLAAHGHDSELRDLLDLAARWPRVKRDYLAATPDSVLSL